MRDGNFLSKGVTSLLNHLAPEEQTNILIHGVINWNELERAHEQDINIIQTFTTTEESKEITIEVVNSFHSLSTHLQSLGTHSINYFSTILPTDHPDVIHEVTDILQQSYHINLLPIIDLLNTTREKPTYSNQTQLYAITCCLSSLIERIITDTIIQHDPTSNPPRILKDLLIHPTTKLVYTPTQLATLQCLVGPPIGMNLRNILWHGFWFPPETDFISLVTYSAVILSIIQNLILIMKVWRINSASPSLIECAYNPNDFDFGQGTFFFSEIVSNNKLEDIIQVVEHSTWTIPSRVGIFRQALTLFRQLVLESNSDASMTCGVPSCYYILVLLLPTLEMQLRRIFVQANNLPEELLYAQSRVFYTTIDMFIGSSFTNDSKWNPEYKESEQSQSQSTTTHNKIIDDLGEVYSSFLTDLLIQPAGPRIRDRIAHFEWRPMNISLLLIDRMFTFWIWISEKFLPQNIKNDHNILLRKVREFMDPFTSCFHASARLQRNLRSTVDSLILLEQLVDSDNCMKATESSSNPELVFIDCLRSCNVNSLVLKNSKLTMQDIIRLLENSITQEYGFPSELATKERQFLSNSCYYYPVKVLDCNSFQISRITALSLIEQSVRIMVTELQLKWNSFKEKILSRKASTRQTNAFTKFSGYIGDYLSMLKIIILLTEENLRSIGMTSNTYAISAIEKKLEEVFHVKFCLKASENARKVSPKWMNKVLVSVQKSVCKLESHIWSEILVFFKSNILPDLFHRFKGNK